VLPRRLGIERPVQTFYNAGNQADHGQLIWLAEEQQSMITITDVAANELRRLLAQQENPNTALRVFVSPGGCSGMSYGMAFDDEEQEGDELIETDGVRVAVDEMSAMYLSGSEIDYVDQLMGGGFTIHNPNAVRSCACGHSFDTGNDAGSARSCS
jgi:iron-sulfur cluster assembly protein